MASYLASIPSFLASVISHSTDKISVTLETKNTCDISFCSPLLDRKKIHSNPNPTIVDEKLTHLFLTYQTPICEIKDLRKHYGIDFDYPPENSNKEAFFQLREQLLLIENFLPSCKMNKESLRNVIKELLLQKKSHEEKMAELGIMLFFLDRDGQLPLENPYDSYLLFRSQEILEEIHALKEHHIKICQEDKHCIPSGKTHYMLRAFAHMVITQAQKLNLGAVHSLIFMLQATEIEIAYHLKPEHREHILVVLSHIASKVQLKNLIEQQIQPHPDMEDLIRLDLKLPKDQKLSSTHIMWACCIALFFDIRQLKSPNCYAIAALIYAIQNGTYKVLTQMIDWITTGHFAFNETLRIPISPLLKKRLICENDLQIKLNMNQAIDLTTMQQITDILGLEKKPSPISKAKKSGRKKPILYESLKKLLQINNLSASLAHAEELYHSFKQNTLIAMMLAMLEFQSANAKQLESESSEYSSDKQLFIDAMMKPLETQSPPALYQKMQEKISQLIWLENFTERHILLQKDKIIAGPKHQSYSIVNFDGDLSALVKTVQHSRRVFFLKQGAYELISTLSGLQHVLKMIADNCEEELGLQKTDQLQQLLSCRTYAKAIAQFCADQIQTKGIACENLLASDLLIFQQTGGSSRPLIEDLFKLKLATQTWEATTAHHFLKNFHAVLNKLDKSLLTQLFFIGSKEHAFTCHPKKWSALGKNHSKFDDYINQCIFDSVTALHKSSISKKVIATILKRFIEAYPSQKIIMLEMSMCKNPTYGSFRREILSRINNQHEQPEKLETIIDQAYMKVSLKVQQLTTLLEKIDITLDQEQLENLHQAWVEKFGTKRAYPFTMARFLYKYLIQQHVKICDPAKLDRAICEQKMLPLSFDIGDLNWSDKDREDPAHIRLIIRYHFGLGRLCYFMRYKDEESLLEDALFSSMKIYYPIV